MAFITKTLASFWFRFALLAILLVFIYSPVLFLQQTVNPDAQMILGNLKGFASISQYMDGLINFRTLDFQPIRDLSLYFDLKMYEEFRINTFIKFNLIIWIISVHLIYGILKTLFPNHSKPNLFLVTFLFAVNPLFSTSICWGMARKHLLSFVFILVATKEVLSPRRSHFKIILFYTLSILSQPITLLWPIWMIVCDYSKRILDSKKIALYGFTMLVMIGMIVINYRYYNESAIYSETYSEKGGELFNLLNRFQALGHYFYQIVFPYRLAFNYEIGGVETYLGILLLLVFTVFSFIKIKMKIEAFGWMIYGFLPLAIVSTDAALLSDTYLLIPTVAVLVLVLRMLENVELPKDILKVFLGLVLFLGLSSSIESHSWRSSLDFAAKDFTKNQNCTAALLNARMGYLNKETIDPDLKKFIAHNNCLNIDTHQIKSKFRLNEFLTVSIYMLYYEDDFSREQKIIGLKKLSQSHYLASFFLAAIALDDNQGELANDYLTDVISKSQKDLPYTYEPIVAKKLQPYCLKINDLKCSEFMKYFSTSTPGLYF